MALTFRAQFPDLREVKADLDALQLGLGRELGKIRREAAQDIATAAKGFTPVGPGPISGARNPNDHLPHLRDTIRGQTRGVVSDHPAAGLFEFGGTIRPRGSDIHIKAQHMAERGAEAQRSHISEQMRRQVEQLVDRF